METVRLRTTHANSRLVAQHEGNLDDASKSSRHQRIAKERVDHGADHQSLRMGRHSIAGHQDHQRRNEIPLWPAITAATQPHSHQASTPPNNSHGRMLEIIVHPLSTPAVLGESIDTTPSGDDQRVEELLAPARPTQPVLPNQQENRQANAVPDERTAHDEMRQALSKVIILTETQGRNTTEEHLRPTEDRHGLTQNAVSKNKEPPNPSLARFHQV